MKFQSQPSIKAQVLTDFILEYTILDEELVETNPKKEESGGFWTMHIDGLSSLVRSGAGLIPTNLKGDITKYALCFGLPTTNNEAENEALTIGLKMVKKLGVLCLKVYSDSQLVIK